jgi:hypothetical protein
MGWRVARIEKDPLRLSTPARGLPEAVRFSGSRAKHPPYSRAAATVFHRLPEHEVCVDC